LSCLLNGGLTFYYPEIEDFKSCSVAGLMAMFYIELFEFEGNGNVGQPEHLCVYAVTVM
jgi:hypothetical protein